MSVKVSFADGYFPRWQPVMCFSDCKTVIADFKKTDVHASLLLSFVSLVKDKEKNV